MWWRRKENDYWVYTKYENRGMASLQFSKSGENGELSETYPLDEITLFSPLKVVSATFNNGELKEKPLRSYPSSSEGPYKIFYSVSEDFVEHPESYGTLGRANTIVKKYLRKHYRVVYIVK
jgi:hypothetical protein